MVDCLVSMAHWLWIVLNSSFSTALFGACAGAFAGAYVSQRIIERGKRKNDLRGELRSTNAAIMVAATICNSYLGFKKQFARPLLQNFEQSKQALLAYAELRKAGRADVPQHHFQAELHDFSLPLVPVETLKDLVYTKLSLVGRPLSAVAHVEQSVTGLISVMDKRRQFAERVQSGAVPDQQLPNYYFGLPLPSGHRDETYPDLVSAIDSYANDIIAFSHYLCDDLIAHGNRVRAAYVKDYGTKIPKVTTIDFSGPRASGLFPPDDEYAAWSAGFVELDSSKPSVRSLAWWKKKSAGS